MDQQPEAFNRKPDPIDLAEVGRPTGLRGLYSLDQFDKSVADAGGYVISVGLKTFVGRGVVRAPVRSVGANPKQPGRFYFAIDDRFKNFPGFGCVWPSPDSVEMVAAVPVRLAPGQEDPQ